MSLNVFQSTIVNATGDTLPAAVIDVYEAGTTTRPNLYSDIGGVTPLTNPFNADSNGFAQFYVASGLYDIEANLGGSGATWSDVELGPNAGEIALKTGATFTGQVKGITPVAAEDLTRKDYVDAQTILGNGFINGGFDFWDYNTSQTSNGYGSDNMWVNVHVGNTKTHSQQSSGDTERALFNSKYYSKTVVTSSAGASNYCAKIQRMEGVNSYANGKATISFWAKADTSKNIAIEFVQNFGTSGSPSSDVTAIGSQHIALTTSWQHFTIIVDIPSIVGTTLGTDNNDYLAFNLWFDAGSDFDTRTDTLGQQSGTFDISEVRIDEGKIAKPYGFVDLESERIRCSKFVRPIGTGGVGGFESSSSCRIGYNFEDNPMRIAPTVTDDIATTNVQRVGAGTSQLTASGGTVSATVSTKNGVFVTCDGFIGATAGDIAIVRSEQIALLTAEL